MNKLDFVPDDIPNEIQKYDSKIQQLEVGKSGKVGILEIELKQGSSKKTSITKQFSRSEERRVGKECRSRLSPYH